MIMLNHTAVLANPPEKPDGEMSEQNGGTPPDKPDGEGENGGRPGGENNANVTHTGATEISEDTQNSNSSYDSTEGSQNALLVTGGESTLENPTVTKTGDSDGTTGHRTCIHSALREHRLV